MSTPIGIDLGTTYCCVAVFKNNTIEVIANGHGRKVTPSFVAFDPEEKEWFVGDTAKDVLAITCPQNSVFDAKRIIGRRYQDEAVREGMKLWPFEVVNETGNPKISLPDGDEKVIISPQEVSAKILEQLKKDASARLDNEVTEAVVTVPANFNDSQREATLEAAERAGLKVLRLLNEPTAAALAYGYNEELKGRFLVFDFGGGTLDISIVDIEGHKYKVLATIGDDQLGGQDIVNNLVTFVRDTCFKEIKYDVKKKATKLAKVKKECEKAKKDLSFLQNKNLFFEGLADGDDYKLKLTRAKFEEINNNIFIKALKTVEKALDKASITKEEITKVIMVGGSSKIPKMKAMLTKFFGETTPILNSMPADEAIAQGAAIMASILNGSYATERSNIILVDIIPRSLGIEVHGGKMKSILAQNNEIPCEETEKFETIKDNQSHINLPIYEGDNEDVTDNYHLGHVAINVPPAKKGMSKINVTFKIDPCGILTVTAKDLTTGHSTNVVINREIQQT